MQNYQRPWWVLAIKMPMLNTTLRENRQREHLVFECKSQPVYRSLGWVVYGPVFAVLTVAIVGLLAATMSIRDQSALVKGLFVFSFAGLPVLAWIASGFGLNHLSKRALQRQIQAETRTVRVTVDAAAQTLQVNQDPAIPFADIRGFDLITDSGLYIEPQPTNDEATVSMANLVMQTETGQIILLQKNEGSIQQKVQLAQRLQHATTIE